MVALTPDASISEADVILRDGRVVRMRTILPTDEKELLQAFERMSEDARYMRFMRSVKEVNVQRLREALDSFPEGGAGIVATAPAADGADIVASAMYVVGKDPTTCEFAITVGSEFGGVGLARSLMDALIDLAKQRGLKTMEGFVLAANGRMLRLLGRVARILELKLEAGVVSILLAPGTETDCARRTGPSGSETPTS